MELLFLYMFTATSFLFLASQALSLDPKGRLNLVFFAFALAAAAWSVRKALERRRWPRVFLAAVWFESPAP